MTQQIDPRFFIPPFVSGVEYKSTQQPTSESSAQDDGSDSNVVDTEYQLVDNLEEYADNAGSVQQDERRLLPPDYITVVSQTARVSSGGTVVDVIIDVEDVAGISEFEVRISK